MNKYKITIAQISKVLERSKNIYLASHINPDGDSIGSIMALGLELEQLDKNIKFIKTDTIPNTFNFLPDIERLQKFDNVEADILFILDCGSKDRIG